MPCTAAQPVQPSPRLLLEREGDLFPVEGDIAEGPETPLLVESVHSALRAFIKHGQYPCVGAKSALQRSAYCVGIYDELGSDLAAEACTQDLQWFAQSGADRLDPEFATLVAVFKGAADSEEAFSDVFWQHLRKCHRLDKRDFPWDAGVSQDPASAEFSYSIGGRAFFLVGMHPYASRLARRLPVTAVVYNLHEQFVRLKQKGIYETIRDSVRDRDAALEGSPNPMVCDHGMTSEAAQYDGLAREVSWAAPFPHRKTAEVEAHRCPF